MDTPDGASVQPTTQQIKQGELFAAWLQSAIERGGLNVSALAKKIGRSPSFLYILRSGGIKRGGVYKRPRPEMVRAIARACNVSADDGLRAAGYLPREERVTVPSVIAHLPTGPQFALARFIESLQVGLDAEGGAQVPIMTAGGEMRSDERLYAPRHLLGGTDPRNAFAFIVPDDSLTGWHILPGDTLLVAATSAPEDGDVALLQCPDRLLLRRVKLYGTQVLYQSHRWGDVLPQDEELPSALVLGVKVGLLRGRNTSFPSPSRSDLVAA